RINSRKRPAVVVTYPDALFEKVVTRRELDKNTLKVKVGDSLSLDFLNEVLFEYHFKRVDFVTEPGEFSLRGGIVDVFSFSHDKPYRIEFFGDEVDSIRTFDVETQLSTDRVGKIAIIPNVEHKFSLESRESFLKYISPNTLIFAKDPVLIYERVDSFFEKARESFENLTKEIQHAEPKDLFVDSDLLREQLRDFPCVELGSTSRTKLMQRQGEEIRFHTKPQPVFNKKFDLLIEDLDAKREAGYTNYIFCATQQQAKRFDDIFGEGEQRAHYQTVVFPLYQGFVDDTLKLSCYTDHQIFERYHKFHLKNGYAKKQAISLKELNKLEIGDYRSEER